jgi:hypothetical protein
MSASTRLQVPAEVEAHWLTAVVQAENARQDYAEYLKSSDRQESEVGRLWIRLWLAERRRDDLYRRMT